MDWMDEYRITEGRMWFQRIQFADGYEDSVAIWREQAQSDPTLNRFVARQIAEKVLFQIKNYQTEKNDEKPYQQRLELLRDAERFDTHVEELWFVKGELEYIRNCRQKAEAYYRRALTINEHYLPALSKLSFVLFQNKRYQDAVEIATQALGINPTGAELLARRAIANELSGQRAVADKDYTRLLDLIKSSETVTLLSVGRDLIEHSLWNSAERIYRAAIRSHIDHHIKLNRRAKGQQNQAFFIDQHKAVEKRDEQAHVGLINALIQKESPDAALIADQAASKFPDSAEIWFAKGLTLQNQSRFEDALAAYDRALALSDFHARALNNRVLILLRQKRYQQALEEAEKLVTQIPMYTKGWIAIGHASIQTKNFQRALEAYEQVIKLDPKSSRGYHGRGVAYSWMSKFTEANAAYEIALKIDPTLYTVLSDIGRNYQNMKQHDRALEYLDRAIALQSNYYHPYYIKACLFAQEGNVEEALTWARKMLDVDPCRKSLLAAEADLKSLHADKRFQQMIS
jgi:superkiller protein 3